MAHAAGTSPPPPTAPLGASGAETIKEFEVTWPPALLLRLRLPPAVTTGSSCSWQVRLQRRSSSSSGGAVAQVGQNWAAACGVVPVVQDQLASCTSQYVEEALGHHFGDLVRFVKAAEGAAKQVPQSAWVLTGLHSACMPVCVSVYQVRQSCITNRRCVWPLQAGKCAGGDACAGLWPGGGGTCHEGLCAAVDSCN